LTGLDVAVTSDLATTAIAFAVESLKSTRADGSAA
jgi:hypothetical protein